MFRGPIPPNIPANMFRWGGVTQLLGGPKTQRWIGAKEAIKAAESAKSIFPRFSFDLISSRPNQTLKDWESELKLATKYLKDHISVYQLTIEKGTPFYSKYKNRSKPFNSSSYITK